MESKAGFLKQRGHVGEGQLLGPGTWRPWGPECVGEEKARGGQGRAEKVLDGLVERLRVLAGWVRYLEGVCLWQRPRQHTRRKWSGKGRSQGVLHLELFQERGLGVVLGVPMQEAPPIPGVFTLTAGPQGPAGLGCSLSAPVTPRGQAGPLVAVTDFPEAGLRD